MFKMFSMGISVGLVVCLIISLGISRAQQQNLEQKRYQKELADATPVRSGVLTEKQRLHSKRFTTYRTMRGDRALASLINEAKSKGSQIAQTEIGVGNGQLLPPESPKTFFGELARTSDAIILGRLTGKTSQVTEDDGFLFTDYDVAVMDVLKDNARASIVQNDTINVTWPGGKVLIDDIILIAIDRNLLPLPTNGHDIVLFLRFLPETGSYYAAKYCAAYELDGSSVRPLTEARLRLPADVILDRDSFLDIVRAVSAK
jgi:hypothetical protein